jgi:hypothetical protein
MLEYENRRHEGTYLLTSSVKEGVWYEDSRALVVFHWRQFNDAHEQQHRENEGHYVVGKIRQKHDD